MDESTVRLYKDVMFDKDLSATSIRVITYIRDKVDFPPNPNKKWEFTRKEIMQVFSLSLGVYKHTIKRLLELGYLEKRLNVPPNVIQWECNENYKSETTRVAH